MNGQWLASRGFSSIGISIRGIPVVAYATPWIGYGCETERISETLSITSANRGSRSQTFNPGTLDGMQPSSPRISSGSVGLGVERFDLARRPVHEQEDARLGLAEPRQAGVGFGGGRTGSRRDLPFRQAQPQ